MFRKFQRYTYAHVMDYALQIGAGLTCTLCHTSHREFACSIGTDMRKPSRKKPGFIWDLVILASWNDNAHLSSPQLKMQLNTTFLSGLMCDDWTSDVDQHTILPPRPCLIIWRAAYFKDNITPRILTFMVRSQVSASTGMTINRMSIIASTGDIYCRLAGTSCICPHLQSSITSDL